MPPARLDCARELEYSNCITWITDYNWRHKQWLYFYSEATSRTPSLYHKTTICWRDASNLIIGKSWVKYPPQWILPGHHSAGLCVMTERQKEGRPLNHTLYVSALFTVLMVVPDTVRSPDSHMRPDIPPGAGRKAGNPSRGNTSCLWGTVFLRHWLNVNSSRDSLFVLGPGGPGAGRGALPLTASVCWRFRLPRCLQQHEVAS